MTFSSVLLALSFSYFAEADNYVSVFKPSKQAKTLSEFKKDIQKEVLQLRFIMSVKSKERALEQKTIELVKNKDNTDPLDI